MTTKTVLAILSVAGTAKAGILPPLQTTGDSANWNLSETWPRANPTDPPGADAVLQLDQFNPALGHLWQMNVDVAGIGDYGWRFNGVAYGQVQAYSGIVAPDDSFSYSNTVTYNFEAYNDGGLAIGSLHQHPVDVHYSFA